MSASMDKLREALDNIAGDGRRGYVPRACLASFLSSNSFFLILESEFWLVLSSPLSTVAWLYAEGPS